MLQDDAKASLKIFRQDRAAFGNSDQELLNITDRLAVISPQNSKNKTSEREPKCLGTELGRGKYS